MEYLKGRPTGADAGAVSRAVTTPLHLAYVELNRLVTERLATRTGDVFMLTPAGFAWSGDPEPPVATHGSSIQPAEPTDQVDVPDSPDDWTTPDGAEEDGEDPPDPSTLDEIEDREEPEVSVEQDGPPASDDREHDVRDED